MKSQWDAIEAQRKNRPVFKKPVVEKAEDLSDSEDIEGPSNQTMETGDDEDDLVANGIQNISDNEEDELDDM